MGALKQQNNVVSIDVYKERKQQNKERCNEANADIIWEIMRIFIEKVRDNENNLYNSADNNIHKVMGKQHIYSNQKLTRLLELKLRNSIPTHIIIYMIGTSFVFGMNLSAIIYQLKYGVKLVDYYILAILGLISIGLFCTSLKLLVEWKEFLENNGESDEEE
jgi:hypothetical protein